ncbi:MAG: class I SAM-dependent methyltransferase [Gaiella sp.]
MTEHRRPELSVRPGFSREDWDRRYASDGLLWTAEPNRRFVAEVGELPPGRALDVGCGEGRNAVWLAYHGWRVTAVDFSEVALEKGRRLAASRDIHVEWVLADVCDYRPATDEFDLVAVLYFQLPEDERRVVLHAAAAALAPGGLLFVLGHDTTNLTSGHGGPQDARVLFTPEDLVGDLDGLVIERAETVIRNVPRDDGDAVAIDALLRARAAPRA